MMNNTLKKAVIALLFAAVFFVPSFADIVIAPNLGYAHNYWWLSEESRIASRANYLMDTSYSTSAFTMGADMMFSHKRTGVSLFFNNQLSFPGDFYYAHKRNDFVTNQQDELKGKLGRSNVILWDTGLLLGHRFRIKKSIISVGCGLGFGLGGRNNGKTIDFTMNIGTTMHLAYDYLFTKKIGLHVSVSDTVGRELSNALVEKNSWLNRFQLKVGPTFKF